MCINSAIILDAFFENTEERFFSLLERGLLENFLQEYNLACGLLTKSIVNKTVSEDIAFKAHRGLVRIKFISSSLLFLLQSICRIPEEVVKEVNGMLSVVDKDVEMQINLHSLDTQFLRVWFLEHINYPKPTEIEKEELSRLTNENLKKGFQPMTKTQCERWFINTRKRSTWKDFFVQYASKDKSTMTKLVSILKGEGENAIETIKALARFWMGEENVGAGEKFDGLLMNRAVSCRNHFLRIKNSNLLQQRPHEKQVDWLSQAIEEATNEYNRMRKRERDVSPSAPVFKQQNEIDGQTDDDDDDADHFQSRKRAKVINACDGTVNPLDVYRPSRNGACKMHFDHVR